ncbi:MAG: acetyl-CoA carboxylase carboxyltransferase subunit alpha [Blastocatellia bacterium]|nr:acetyl-CoA carboxylase carboxyltransferase subunit alpha [Blastocatellia bacterium]MBL8193314.1 acetyl-CoA carboxylase carboxyltransferase subunit alpha [Blastocatellia bacterium]
MNDTETLSLEKELQKLEQQINELLKNRSEQNLSTELKAEIDVLRSRIDELQQKIHSRLSPMDRVRNARHQDRPYTLDFAHLVFENFQEIHGDRRYADDSALVCGFAQFLGEPVMIIGHQKANLKSRKTEDRKMRNFGMPKPEGYRKALRVMKLAEKFNRPIFCFIDTPGAYPGIEAEERGQAEAIARNLIEMARIRVPIIITVTGEGGSGGALAIGVGDIVYILENAVYSVISPEGCAAILWKDSAKADKAAESMKITAQDLKALGIIDEIIPEPKGGAHKDYETMANILKERLAIALASIRELPITEMLERRYEKFRSMGAFEERFL